MSANDGGRFIIGVAPSPTMAWNRYDASANDGIESLRRERHYDAMMMIAVIMIAVMMMNAGIAAVVTALPRRR